MWGRPTATCASARLKSGSSPRMWGRRTGGAEDQPVRVRFIPTHVGQTPTRRRRAQVAAGSSPRMWGRRLNLSGERENVAVHPHACGADVASDAARRRVVRFIPTHVGQTSRTFPASSAFSVHPHACGADALFPRPPAGVSAVHPHACGADLWREKPPRVFLRFIPTHVGQTSSKVVGSYLVFRFIPTHVGQTLS